jgi:hypothetical protein
MTKRSGKIDRDVCILERKSGEELFDHIEPLHTKIKTVITTKANSIILEDPAGFPSKESNLYCISAEGDLIWRAEKPSGDTLYDRIKLQDDGQAISAYTTGRHACELDVMTGKLLSQVGFQ